MQAHHQNNNGRVVPQLPIPPPPPLPADTCCSCSTPSTSSTSISGYSTTTNGAKKNKKKLAGNQHQPSSAERARFVAELLAKFGQKSSAANCTKKESTRKSRQTTTNGTGSCSKSSYVQAERIDDVVESLSTNQNEESITLAKPSESNRKTD